MKKIFAIALACLLLLASAPMVYAEEMHECDWCCEQLKDANGNMMPEAECRHSDYLPYNIEYRDIHIGCERYTRKYYVCRNCGADVSWVPYAGPFEDHRGPYQLVFFGYDEDGNMIYKMQCKACGGFV